MNVLFQVDILDALPKQLCTGCVNSIESFYRFKIRCEYIDQKLRDSVTAAHSVSVTQSPPSTEDELVKTDTPTDDDHHQLDDCGIEEYVYEEDSTTEDGGDHLIYETHEDLIIEDVSGNEYQLSEEDDEHEGDVYVSDGSLKYKIEVQSIDEERGDVPSVMESIIEKDDEEPTSDKDADATSEYSGELQSEFVIPNEINEYSEPASNPQSPSQPEHQPSEATFECDRCNASFQSPQALRKHTTSTHDTPKKRFTCDICDRWFSMRFHLKNHMATHEGQKNFECTSCSKRYTNQGNLDRHVRVFHNKLKGYACDLCDKSFSQSTILRQHRSTHTDERNFECDICEKRFKTPEYLTMHKQRHLPVELRPKRAAKRSPQAPSKKKICTCTLCGKKCNSAALHQSHMRTHTGEKPYECHYCQKRFSFYQSLKSHLLLHTGEKPFKCDDCGAAFRQIGHLHGHRLTHTGQKEHHCTICAKSFALRGNLTVHMRLHTGETPYTCNYCPRGFYDSNGLKRHTKMHVRNRDALNGGPLKGAKVDEVERPMSGGDPHDDGFGGRGAEAIEMVAEDDESEMITLYMTADGAED